MAFVNVIRRAGRNYTVGDGRLGGLKDGKDEGEMAKRKPEIPIALGEQRRSRGHRGAPRCLDGYESEIGGNVPYCPDRWRMTKQGPRATDCRQVSLAAELALLKFNRREAKNAQG